MSESSIMRPMTNSHDLNALREYVDTHIAGINKERQLLLEGIRRERDVAEQALVLARDNHAALHHSMKIALDLAVDALEKRLALLNEFRAQSVDESRKYATMESLANLERVLGATVSGLDTRLDASLKTIGIRLESDLKLLDTLGHKNETQIQLLAKEMLGTAFEEAVDKRFRPLERAQWMTFGIASFVAAFISVLMYFIRRGV